MKNNKPKDNNNISCSSIDALIYLKRDEISVIDSDILQRHLKECISCRSKYSETQEFLKFAEFEDSNQQSRLIVSGIIKEISGISQKKFSYSKISILTRYYYRSLTAACLFLILIFSIEQINTLLNINKLENQISQQAPSSSQSRRQADLLVINNFVSLNDIKKAVKAKFDDQANVDFKKSIFLFGKSKEWQFLSEESKKEIVRQLIINKSFTSSILIKKLSIEDSSSKSLQDIN